MNNSFGSYALAAEINTQAIITSIAVPEEHITAYTVKLQKAVVMQAIS